MTARRASRRRPEPQEPPLDPAVIRLIDALARAQAKEDHEREIATAEGDAEQ